MMFPEFKEYWILFSLVFILPYVYFIGKNKKRKGSIKFSSVNKIKKIKPSLKYKFINLPLYLRIIAITLIIIALSGPRKGVVIKQQITNGIAIQMVIDKSGSMQQLMNFKNKKMTRLEVVKKVFNEFVN